MNLTIPIRNTGLYFDQPRLGALLVGPVISAVGAYQFSTAPADSFTNQIAAGLFSAGLVLLFVTLLTARELYYWETKN